MSLDPVVVLESEDDIPDVEVSLDGGFVELRQDKEKGSLEQDLVLLTRQQAEKLMMTLDLILSEGEDE